MSKGRAKKETTDVVKPEGFRTAERVQTHQGTPQNYRPRTQQQRTGANTILRLAALDAAAACTLENYSSEYSNLGNTLP